MLCPTLPRTLGKKGSRRNTSLCEVCVNIVCFHKEVCFLVETYLLPPVTLMSQLKAISLL